MARKRLEIFLEFLVFGIIMGVVEDVIAIKLATGQPITWHTLVVIVLVAIPFAFIGEILVDRHDLIKTK